MSLFGGRFAFVNGVSTMRGWSAQITNSPAKFVASNTKAGSGRIAGVNDWSGSVRGYGGTPPVMPGEALSFDGVMGSVTEGAAGDSLAGATLCSSVEITWDFTSGTIIGWTVNFEGNGKPAVSTATLADATSPDVPGVCAITGIVFTDTGDVIIDNVTTATLTLSSELQAYSNSSTVDTGECWTKRVAGPIDGSLSIGRQDTDLTAATSPQRLSSYPFKLYVDGTDFWHITEMFVKDYSGLEVDRESGAVVAYTIDCELNVWDGSALGSIVQPGAGSDWWPV